MLNDTLQKFGKCSGHSVNKEKSQIYFLAVVDEDLASQITNTLGVEYVNDLGNYLGVTLFHKRVTNATYSFVVDKVHKRLNGWNVKMLSLAERVTLAKSVLFSIPSYFMQSALIPKEVCLEIEKIIRKFVWRATSMDQKLSLVSWDKCCMPMDRGGLGFRHLHFQNKAFLLKLGMNFVNNMNDFWVRVLRSKYKVENRVPRNDMPSNCSFV